MKKCFEHPDKKRYLSKKDPILFGLMTERRVLYFVGDWVDDFCNLTLDQIADVLGYDPCENIGNKLAEQTNK